MEIYKKIQACRQAISMSDMKKFGYNRYSDYFYFLPEQVEKLVKDVCFDEKLFTKYDLNRDEHGIFATLTVIDIEKPEDKAVFTIVTDIPTITATNIAQQLGGTVTYSERYLKMSTFGITDNTLDFDADPPPRNPIKKGDKKTPQKSDTKEDGTDKKWLNKYSFEDKTKIHKDYWNIVKNAKDNNKTVKDLQKHYKISKAVETELETDLLT